MSTNLSRYCEKARLDRGLKPSHLAQLAGCKNLSKHGSDIRLFELHGDISPFLLDKLIVALDLDRAVVRDLMDKDREQMLAEWNNWADEPIEPYLVVRLIPGVYTRQHLPEDIKTLEEAEVWAAEYSKRMPLRRCLVWSRRLSVWFAADGQIKARTSARPDHPNSPFMQLGRFKLLFGPDFQSFYQVG